MPKSNLFKVLLLIMAVAIFAGGILLNNYLTKKNQQQLSQVHGTVFPEPRSISPFELVYNKDQAFTKANLNKQWSLIFFGFTHCPVVCPTTMALLNQAYTKLQQDKYQPLPQVIFVSVDPERDNPTRTAQYAAGFNPKFIGITGTEPQLKQLTKELNVVYMKVMMKPTEPGEAATYTIDHSMAIMLIDPQGNLKAILSSPETADQFVSDYKTITKLTN